MQEKFERLFHEFKPEAADFGPWSHGPQAFLHGEKGEGKLITLRAFDKKVFHIIPFLSDSL